MRNWNISNTSSTSFPHQVLSLPMRNWNSYMYGIKSRHWDVLSLPMRNWNYHHLGRPASSKWRFWAYLWGIETLLYRYCLCFLFQVLSLPMRNWNFLFKAKSWFHSIVLSLPMRNWNFSLKEDGEMTEKGFEPTYEELKQSKNACPEHVW